MVIDETDYEFDEENIIPEPDLRDLPVEGRLHASTPSLRVFRTLTVLATVSYLGAAPILRKNFEELLYFIDCLLPSTGREVWEGAAIKNEESPLRPDWGDAINSLVGYGLASVERVGDKRPISIHCELDITDRGRQLVFHCREIIQEIDDAWDAAMEIGLAYLKWCMDRYDEQNTITFDKTFCDLRFSRNDVIDYGEYESLNLTSNHAKNMILDLGVPIGKIDGTSEISPQIYLSWLAAEGSQA